jgi:hypothetical protein
MIVLSFSLDVKSWAGTMKAAPPLHNKKRLLEQGRASGSARNYRGGKTAECRTQPQGQKGPKIKYPAFT